MLVGTRARNQQHSLCTGLKRAQFIACFSFGEGR